MWRLSLYLLLLQPAASNDAGFAMTSSFTSMMLTALLVFDPTEFAVKAERFEVVSSLARKILDNAEDVKELVDLDFNRVIYLGAGPFFGLAHEAQLKILELTAGHQQLHEPSPSRTYECSLSLYQRSKQLYLR